ncbi:GNAT family N-acetyltransferase [Crocinitomix catalasitica]|uniref:GNAT family N-acetyltransferase n=1 Tax=Crocinitomix catalasitica TaxID=184607 RepID=UPI000482D9D4|nr:GNAT family N-acetyltransferase [Crocinitomix catalasitica]
MLYFEDAKLSDLPVIVEIYNSTITSQMATADIKPVSLAEKKPWFNAHTSDANPIWLVKNNDDEIVGWVSFQQFYGREAYNSTKELSIYIAESFRQKGYGKEILDYCITEAPKFKIKTLLAFIFGHNEASIHLFSRFGFQKWGILPQIATFDTSEKDLIIMGLRVD